MIRPAVEIKLMNQLNTTPAVTLPHSKYASSENRKDTPTATYGAPNLLVFMKMAGAWPSAAMPYSVRAAVKRTPFPDEKALVMTIALMIDGRT